MAEMLVIISEGWIPASAGMTDWGEEDTPSIPLLRPFDYAQGERNTPSAGYGFPIGVGEEGWGEFWGERRRLRIWTREGRSSLKSRYLTGPLPFR